MIKWVSLIISYKPYTKHHNYALEFSTKTMLALKIKYKPVTVQTCKDYI